MTQVYFNGHGVSFPFAACDDKSIDCDAGRAAFVTFLGTIFFSSFSNSFFSAGADAAALLKSKAVPGVLGVLVDEPNEAKAPDPRPKALEPATGEDIPLVLKGVTVLKGLFLPWEEVLPKRLELEKSREWPSLPSCLSVLSMDRESLPPLLHAKVSTRGGGMERCDMTYFERRVQRLLLSLSI